MANGSVIFVAAGDLASRAIAKIHAEAQGNERKLIAIARRAKSWSGAEAWQGDIASDEILAKLVAAAPQVIVVTLVPNGEREDGYRRGYLEPLHALIAALAKAEQKPMIIFASSTGVYHQESGDWVDEQSPTEPQQYTGRYLLACEQLLARSGLPFCCVRFGGIYGPGRDFLIRQVQAGQGGGSEYTNRIHSDDAAGVLVFLIERCLMGLSVPQVVVACDHQPAPANEVRSYIAKQLGLASEHLRASPTSQGGNRGGNKRCRNQLLLDLGYCFRYPSFVDGYKNAVSTQ